MTQVRFQTGAIVELDERRVLIIGVHGLLIARKTMLDSATDATPADRGNRRRSLTKVVDHLGAFIGREIRSRFEEDHVDDQR